MLKGLKNSFSIALIFTIFISGSVTAQVPCPDYLFSVDLGYGSSHPDIRVMQQILNLDTRTKVADVGAGSTGFETTYFGVATRVALKRFQALFIEYIGIANGRFGPKTRTSMNAVCQGPYFTGGGGQVYDPAPTTPGYTDVFPPVVAIAGPTDAVVGDPFRAYLASNESLQTPGLDGLIITNATAGDMRKISSTTFSFLVTPNANAVNQISLQFEADTILDLAGNKNENASNEWIVNLHGGNQATNTLASYTLPYIDLPIATGGTNVDCSTVASVEVTDYSNPCYGRAPTFDSSGGGGGGQNQIMEMLKGMLQGMMGGGGGFMEAGGKLGSQASCACSGLPTIGFSPVKGIGPRAIDFIKIGKSSGFFTGREGPPPGVCGQAIVKGKCINPQNDVTGLFVGGTLIN